MAVRSRSFQRNLVLAAPAGIDGDRRRGLHDGGVSCFIDEEQAAGDDDRALAGVTGVGGAASHSGIADACRLPPNIPGPGLTHPPLDRASQRLAGGVLREFAGEDHRGGHREESVGFQPFQVPSQFEGEVHLNARSRLAEAGHCDYRANLQVLPGGAELPVILQEICRRRTQMRPPAMRSPSRS